MVIGLDQAADALYAVGLFLATVDQTVGAEAVILLSKEVKRRVAALHLLVEQREQAAAG